VELQPLRESILQHIYEALAWLPSNALMHGVAEALLELQASLELAYSARPADLAADLEALQGELGLAAQTSELLQHAWELHTLEEGFKGMTRYRLVTNWLVSRTRLLFCSIDCVGEERVAANAQHVQCAVVDGACQVSEAQLVAVFGHWPYLQHVLLAGNPGLQPPEPCSAAARRLGYGRSLFGRLLQQRCGGSAGRGVITLPDPAAAAAAAGEAGPWSTASGYAGPARAKETVPAPAPKSKPLSLQLAAALKDDQKLLWEVGSPGWRRRWRWQWDGWGLPPPAWGLLLPGAISRLPG
jgi:hypothetical protein